MTVLPRRPFLALAAGATAAAALQPGPAQAADRFVYANNSNYDTLDPHVVFDVARVATRLNFYDGLYRWVDNPPKLIPWLAESHEVSADGITWTFKLRGDVKFHDGSLLTAEDVVYSIERIMALNLGTAPLFRPILQPGSTKAVDPRHVQFTLNEPSAIFGSLVPDITVVNSKLVKRNERENDWGRAWLARNVAGSGSYTLRRYDPAVGFIASRFPAHFAGWGPKYFDEIEFRTVLETNTRVLGMIRGDYHGTDGYMTPDQIDRFRQSGKVQILDQESMRVFHFCIHNNRAPMNDINFRRALVQAFDYDGFINDVLKGSVVRNATVVPNNMWGRPPGVTGHVFDLDKAKAALAQVRAPLRPITIGTLAGFSETEQAASVFQANLRKIGIEARIESAPWPTVSTRMRKEDTQYDLVPYWKSTYYADPNNWIGELYGSRYIGGGNVSYYTNAEVDKRINAALASSDQAERERLYAEAGQMVFDDAAGVWIYNTKWYGPYAKTVAGIRFCPIGNGQDMRWAHFA